MSNNGSGVIDEETPASETQGQDPSGEGKSPSEKELENRIRQNLRAEYDRKLKESISEVREEMLAQKEDRLVELQEKGRPTEKDVDEIASLESQISAIKSDPRSKAWTKYSEEISGNIADARTAKLAAEMAQDLAEEYAEAEKMPFDKFERELVRWMKKVDPSADLNSYRRVKKAYKAYKDDQSYKKRLDDLEVKERQYSESGTNRPLKNPSKAELLEEAKKTPEGMENYLKVIAGVQGETSRR